MGWVIFWIVCGFASAYIAGQKNKSGGAWFFVGLLLGPLAVLMVGLSPAAPVQDEERPFLGLRKCPWCAEDIKTEAVVCKHCGRDVIALVDASSKIAVAYGNAMLKNGTLSDLGMRIELERQGFKSAEINLFLAEKLAPGPNDI